MNLNYLQETLKNTIQFIKNNWKNLYFLVLYRVFLTLGVFILVHQQVTYALRVSKISLVEFNLLDYISQWQTILLLIASLPLLLLINAFTIRAIEDEYHNDKKSIKYSLVHFGNFNTIFIIFYGVLFLLFYWFIKTLSYEHVGWKIISDILIIGISLFLFLFFRFIPIKTLTNGSFIKSAKDIFQFIKTRLLGSAIILITSIALFILFEIIIINLELNGAYIYEKGMHLNIFMFIILILVLTLKEIIHYFIYLLEIHFILNLKKQPDVKMVNHTKKNK